MKSRRKSRFVPDGEKVEEGQYGTLWKEYAMPLLEVLIKLGGEAKAKIVVEAIPKEMDLPEVDHEILSSGRPRWEANVRWLSGLFHKLCYVFYAMHRHSPKIQWRIGALPVDIDQ